MTGRATHWGDGEHLTHWLFSQGDIWITADARPLEIDWMESTHVLNALLMIERMSDIPVEDVHGSLLYQTMLKRLTYLLKLGEVAELEQRLREAATPEDDPKFTMPNRRIETTFSGVKDVLLDVQERQRDAGYEFPRFKLHYRKENGEESHRTIQTLEVFERHVALGFPELYLKGVDIDLMEIRQFRADRILRIEEVPA